MNMKRSVRLSPLKPTQCHKRTITFVVLAKLTNTQRNGDARDGVLLNFVKRRRSRAFYYWTQIVTPPRLD
jgi:hypothetical protein